MSFPTSVQDSPFESVLDHYAVLEVKPDATASEIRESYFRLKMTYQKDSAALYTLIDDSEREEMLKKVEDAYNILSNPDRRRAYDSGNDRIDLQKPVVVKPVKPIEPAAKVISIDRVPPMESSVTNEDLLTPPRTDFAEAQADPISAQADLPAPQPSPQLTVQSPAVNRPQQISSDAPAPALYQPGPSLDMLSEIKNQKEWSGEFLKRVRESHSISIHELSNATKITKAYIAAIEDEEYSKLPAAVFVRGFVSQISRHLKLPSQEVASAYMTRYQRLKPEN